MSYPPQGGHLPYAGPQQGYQQPPPGQYPPQGYPPQQQGYGAPPQGYPPQGHYPPQQHQGYPPQQQHGYPPQQHQGYPSQQPPYGAPSHSPYPQQQPYGAPPHSPNPYGAPPSGQYGAPQHQNPPYGGAPPQAPYGAPPPQPYGAPAPIPTPPSPGYAPNHAIQYDARQRASDLRRAMKGFGTDEALLIRTLAHIPPLEIPCLISTYPTNQDSKGRILENDIKSETSGNFEKCLLSILRGPLQNDVEALEYALDGAGTKEDWLNDVLIGRSNADIHAIKHAYQAKTHRSLESDIRSDLSLKTERLFSMILASTRQEDSAPVLPQNVKADVDALYHATEGRVGTDQLTVCAILSNRSDGQIRAIAHEYKNGQRHGDLEKVIKKEFAGHMEGALLQMLRCGTDRAMRDAKRLEACMIGPGTKDYRLVAVVTALHWDRQHMAQVKGAYRHAYGKELAQRIRGDTSGDYERCLVAMVE